MPDDEFQAQLAADPHIRIERLARPGMTRAINRCVETSTADVVLFLDDDASPHFGWLEAHAAAFTDNTDLAYTAGREVRSTKEKPAFSIYVRIMVEFLAGLFIEQDKKLNGRIVGWINWLGIMFGNFDQPGICLINSPRGCNMAIRRDFFMNIGGFNEAFRGNAWGNETEFGLRAVKAGKYGQYRGDAIVVHHEFATGGCRDLHKSQWFKDFLYNQKLVIHSIGPQAWLGALPRLVKNIIWVIRS